MRRRRSKRVVRQFFLAEHLDAGRVDQVQVAYQVGGGHAVVGDGPVGGVMAGDPAEGDFVGVVVDQFLDRKHGKFRVASELAGGQHAVHRGRVGFAGQRFAQRLVGHELGQFGQDVQVLLRGGFGNEQTEQHGDRLAVGRVEGMGWARRMNAASAWSRPLTRPCGTATPWPSAVEPSRSRENRLSNTTERANP